MLRDRHEKLATHGRRSRLPLLRPTSQIYGYYLSSTTKWIATNRSDEERSEEYRGHAVGGVGDDKEQDYQRGDGVFWK